MVFASVRPSYGVLERLGVGATMGTGLPSLIEGRHFGGEVDVYVARVRENSGLCNVFKHRVVNRTLPCKIAIWLVSSVVNVSQAMENGVKVKNQFLEGDYRQILRLVEEETFSACITDPPYNYEFIGKDWNVEEIERRCERVKESKTLVQNIPYGSGLAGGVRNARWYEKNRQNILNYGKWCYEWAKEIFRVLKHGAYALVFNSTRTIAHVQVALERVGFYARDVLVWRRHAGIPKGFNGKKIQSDKEGSEWEGWHSCLRNEWEAICVVY